MSPKIVFAGLCAALLIGAAAGPAYAYDFTRPLQQGDEGDDVSALQVRVAGWLERADQRRLRLSGFFDGKTAKAVTAFQTHYGLEADGIAGPSTFEALNALEDEDGSTANFDWSEFDQNINSRCSEAANKYAGTFKGGKVPRAVVRWNVTKVMWRLEALRAKGGDKPIGINSGFRSVAYNSCIGGASLSQHMYGTAVDMRVAEAKNHYTRFKARRSQFHGIGCYQGFSHNHLDLRLDNEQLPEAQYWWWPDRDKEGRDLADNGQPCYGETTGHKASRMMLRVVEFIPGADALVPSARQVEDFEDAPEAHYGGHAD
jgi:hypothetical protein